MTLDPTSLLAGSCLGALLATCGTLGAVIIYAFRKNARDQKAKSQIAAWHENQTALAAAQTKGEPS